MICHKVDLFAGEFNGTAWRCQNRGDTSAIDEAFDDCEMPTPPSPTPLCGPGSVPNFWTDVCGFLSPPDSDQCWKVRKHGAFSIPRQTLGLRPTDQSCHDELWLHIDLVGWRNHDESDQRVRLSKRQGRRISEIMSDSSFCSLEMTLQTCREQPL